MVPVYSPSATESIPNQNDYFCCESERETHNMIR